MAIRWLPTRAADWRLVGRTAGLVLSIPVYALTALASAVVGMTLFVAVQNGPLLRFVLFGPLPLENRVTILVNLYPFVGSGFGTAESAILVATGAVVGVNAAMLAYHLREREVSLRGGTGSFGGIVLGALGAGCAACGTALVAGVLGVFGAAGLIALLPLGGLEFALVALAVVGLSTFWLAEGMRGGEVRGCPIDPRD